ncbi:tRNA-binding protein [Candidatus Pacearchaeota archaeon]|nr:tRNA-binding protein [Candidatus Pacearchaeota archaeon]|tara:strand:+ start:217 stop:561 length:345 start_codon:yes stop_codon:yes gene_type:complete
MEGVAQLEYKDWQKADLRVAEIKKVEEIEGADKLFKLTLDVGEIGTRTICAGIKEFYESKDLANKKIAYLSNLAPRKMKGVESQGMLLAAFTDDEAKIVLLALDSDIENGSQIG